MPVFFNGRSLVSPVVVSKVDDTAMANRNLTVGNVVAVIGPSAGGAPNTLLRFGSPSQAAATLRDGELLDAVRRAFYPSAATDGPSEVVAVRVNPATQASLTILDTGDIACLSLLSTDSGIYTNQIKVKIESGTNLGKKVTVQLGDDLYVGDDLNRNLFSILYTGAAATAVMSLQNTSCSLEAPSGTTLATIDLNAYDTVQKLVDRINAVTGFTAAVVDGNGARTTLNQVDRALNQDVKTVSFTAVGQLQAVIDWINSTGEGLVTATRANNAQRTPKNIPFTYLAGAVDGTVVNGNYQSAFDLLQGADVQWITPVSSNAAIHAMASAHCAFMSSQGRRERRAICGTAIGTTDAAAIAAAKALNSDRVSLVHLGTYAFNAAGVLTLYPPYVTAAGIAGMFAGVNPGTPLTNKTLAVAGVERRLRNPTDTDVLINGGVLAIEDRDGFRVVKSISTWLTNLNYNRVEQSCGVAADFVARNVREALGPLIGSKASPNAIARAIDVTESALIELARAEPQGPGVIVGDPANPAFKNIAATLAGDVMRVEFQCSPVIPLNYILLTISAVPYQGSAAAS